MAAKARNAGAMVDGHISLDGIWELRHGDPLAPARAATVPAPWQAVCPDLRTTGGTGWYRRQLTVPAGWLATPATERLWLHFGAVFHTARVTVNGLPVGENAGGFLPFAFDVTDQLVPGDRNELVVEVTSPADDDAAPGGGLAEWPHGKQSWYGPLSGIWQSVRLERRHRDHIARIRVLPDARLGQVDLDFSLAQPLTAPASLDLVILGPAEDVVTRSTVDLPGGEIDGTALLAVPAALSWSPDRPRLYRLVATLSRNGRVLDRTERSFGFRTVEVRDGRLLLNGNPFYLRGALDQDYYPDGICTAPSLAFLEDQLRKAKQLGLNTLRCHIKVPDPRYYEVADRLGMLVWTELPNSGRTTPASRARAEALLRGIVDRDGHHPSIGIWTIVNENWGTDLVHNAEHRGWLRRTFDWLKSYDPTRLVVDNSPLAPSMHVKTDIADFHYYAAIPDHRDEWDRFVEDLAQRPAWLFHPDEPCAGTGREALMCSEFGNWGLPDPAALRGADGREPWWFETGHDWGDGVMYPHGVEQRFSDWSLGRAFGSLRGLVEAAQWQQFRALKYQIEAMRRQPSLAGYVITELTDCHWESNGLLDMRRNPRVFHEAFATINADTVIVPRWSRLAYWAGERAELELAIAHGAGPALEGAVLEITLCDNQMMPVPALAPGEVGQLGRICVEIPRDAEGRYRLRLELRHADGHIIASNHLDLAVHHRRASAFGGRVWSPEPAPVDHLAGLGVGLAPSAAAADLVLARRPDEHLAAYVREGGRLLLMADADLALQPFFPHWQNVRVQHRDGTMWRGDWASSFAWLDRSGAFAALPGGPLLDETFDRVIPTHVIAGCNTADFQARVHAGLVVGWIHKPVALAVERRYGDGRLVASTFRLFRDPPGADPTATILLDRLLTLAAGSVATAVPAALESVV